MHLAGVAARIQGSGRSGALTLFEQKYRDSGHTLWQFYGAATAHVRT